MGWEMRIGLLAVAAFALIGCEDGKLPTFESVSESIQSAGESIQAAATPGLTIKGLRIGMTRAEVERAASANGFVVGVAPELGLATGEALYVAGPDCDQSDSSLENGCTTAGALFFEGDVLERFRLNTRAFSSQRMDGSVFVDQLALNYGLEISGVRERNSSLGGSCLVYDGVGPGNAVISIQDCPGIVALIEVRQSDASFN